MEVTCPRCGESALEVVDTFTGFTRCQSCALTFVTAQCMETTTYRIRPGSRVRKKKTTEGQSNPNLNDLCRRLPAGVYQHSYQLSSSLPCLEPPLNRDEMYFGTGNHLTAEIRTNLTPKDRWPTSGASWILNVTELPFCQPECCEMRER